MRICCRIFLFSLQALLVFSINAPAQVKKLVSGDLSGASFSQFVQVIESQSDYHFFFKAEQVDSLTISIQFKNQSLATVLDLVFRGTDLHYAIDDQHHVFVIKKYKIETELP